MFHERSRCRRQYTVPIVVLALAGLLDACNDLTNLELKNPNDPGSSNFFGNNKVTLTLPATGAPTDLAPTLDWDDVADAAGYTV